MLNKWDQQKQDLYNHIHENIVWNVDSSKPDGSVLLSMNFIPSPQFPVKGVSFPEIGFIYRDDEEYQDSRAEHYDSAATFYTMVALDEDIIVDYSEERAGFLRTERIRFLPSNGERAVPFLRLWRFKFSQKRLSFVKGEVDWFYERSIPSPSGFLSVKVSLS